MATKILMHFGEVSVPGILNDSETSQAFAQHLPTTISVSGTGIDFCGHMGFSLPYQPSQVHHGWKNGDINYNPGGGWFALLFDDEENSQRYGDQINLGRVEGSLDVLHALSGSFHLYIECVK